MELARKKVNFQPQARLVSILGEQMISDAVVGLVELVKNAYDADATSATVTLADLESETASLTVLDDGFGMTPDDVVSRFLSPAIDTKARAKIARERTPRYKRLPIGEKGVGRFALQQLGRRLEVVTRSAFTSEVHLLVDWDAFNAPNAKLSEVEFDMVEREPEVFRDNQTGTRLVLTHLRDYWDRTRIEKLQRAFRLLRSPHVEDGKQDFDVFLKCPAYQELENLDQGDIRERYHYRFRALVESDGTLHAEYEAKHPARSPRTACTPAGGRSLKEDAAAELSGQVPLCGAFYLNMYVWDRTAAYLSTSGISRKELDSVAGVSLFRDKLRVLPYGEPGDDWLFLDRNRINNPSERIGNNQVVGYVEIEQEANSDLRDKTNREGLIENSSFRDLRALVRASIRYFETLWRDDRPEEAQSNSSQIARPASGSIRQARNLASVLGSTASDEIAVTVPTNILPGESTNHRADTPSLVLTQREIANRVVSELDDALVSQRQVEERQREERAMLMHLAATGLAAERMIHEVGRQAVSAIQAAENLRGGSSVEEIRAVLESALGTLRNELRVLSPETGITRFQRRRDVSISEAIRVAVALNRNFIESRRLSMAISEGDFVVIARPSSIVQVFDNVINNASHWASADRAPSISVQIQPDTRSVIIQDNGPGLQLERPEAAFEPMVSTRAGGHGMGLYVVKQLLDSEGGRIAINNPGSAGASFTIYLSALKSASKEIQL